MKYKRTAEDYTKLGLKIKILYESVLNAYLQTASNFGQRYEFTKTLEKIRKDMIKLKDEMDKMAFKEIPKDCGFDRCKIFYGKIKEKEVIQDANIEM